MAVGKIRFIEKNLIGEKRDIYLSSIWILKSNIQSINVSEQPIYIAAPHVEWTSVGRLNYYFVQLISKLQDPKIVLIEFVPYQISKTGQRRLKG